MTKNQTLKQLIESHNKLMEGLVGLRKIYDERQDGLNDDEQNAFLDRLLNLEKDAKGLRDLIHKLDPMYSAKPESKLSHVETELNDFTLITYYIDAEKVEPLIHPRFKVKTILDEAGKEKALISVVSFQEKNFKFRFCPWFTKSFYQTDYRVYVEDTTTKENVVWFLGTVTDSWFSFIPRLLWRIPWKLGGVHIDKWGYKLALKADNSWVSNSFLIDVAPRSLKELAGFDTLEQGLALLTNPSKGYYYKKSGNLGFYKVWHDPIKVRKVNLLEGHFKFLKDTYLESDEDMDFHSALYCSKVPFTVLLPPKTIKVK